MKKLFLMATVATFAFAGASKAEESASVVETPAAQVESVVIETSVTNEIVEEIVVDTPKNTMQPLAAIDKPIVAVFYADWCGSCKILEPRLEAAMSQLADKDAVKIVKFDLTDDTTKAKSAAMAGENGLTDMYNEKAPKTGFAVLVQGDAATEPVTLTKSDSIAEIKAKLEAFIAASKS